MSAVELRLRVKPSRIHPGWWLYEIVAGPTERLLASGGARSRFSAWLRGTRARRHVRKGRWPHV